MGPSLCGAGPLQWPFEVLTLTDTAPLLERSGTGLEGSDLNNSKVESQPQERGEFGRFLPQRKEE